MPSKAKPKPNPPHLKLQFEAIGTHWVIEAHEPVPAAIWRQLKVAIHHRIEQFDRDYSRFRDDSLISAMAREPGSYRLPEDARPLLDLYQELYGLTDGGMTPLIGACLEAAGYDATYSLQPKKLEPPPSWQKALGYDYPYLTLKQPALLDFGAAGKGYLVDLIGQLLLDHGLTSYCINAGGDLIVNGLDVPMAIGLENPHNARQVIGVAHLSSGSLCGSAGNRRAWSTFNHIIDPQSLVSPRHIEAVWVQAKTALLADALTTALYFASPATLAAHYQFEWAILAPENVLTYSAQFPATFFNQDAT